MLSRDHRGEGAEFFAIFDVAIEAVTHCRVVRCRQNAAMPERPRSELERAFDPPDDLLGSDCVGPSVTVVTGIVTV